MTARAAALIVDAAAHPADAGRALAARAAVATARLEGSQILLRACAWCGRYESGGQWYALPTQLDLPTSHGMCPACYRRGL